MFDKYIIDNGGPSHVTVTKTVHEHRAPTDQSVKLLSEMEEKAIARIMHGQRLEASGLEVFYLAIRPRFDDGDYELRYVFRLNGKDIDGRVIIRRGEWERLAHDRGERMRLVYQRAREDIANAILKKFPVDPDGFGMKP